MSERPVQSFDDPALKEALRRSLGRDAAPAGLRDRIRALAAESQSGGEQARASEKPIPMFRRSPLYRLAVAAVLVIGFGGLGYRIWQMQQKPDYTPGYAIPNSLYKAMIDTHSARAAAGKAGDSAATLAAAPGLSGQIGRAVFVADLTKDGWTFEGGGVRNVGSHPSAQLFFTKGKATISVFSLPSAAAPGSKDGMTYDTVFGGMPIAGFTRGNGLFCIVGSSPDGSLEVAEVRGLLERHRGELSGT